VPASSSAAAPFPFIVLALIGAAVLAGLAALAIGLALSRSAAQGAAYAGAGPMASAETSPLYEANINEGRNPLYD